MALYKSCCELLLLLLLLLFYIRTFIWNHDHQSLLQCHAQTRPKTDQQRTPWNQRDVVVCARCRLQWTIFTRTLELSLCNFY